MANIATVTTAAFVKPDVPRGRVTARALLRAMTHYGSTYCVPVWTYDDYPRRCIYVQHGEKWSPTGVNGAWARYHTVLDALWVRWYDSGDDFDVIFRHDRGSSRLCLYGFDAVRIVLAPGAGPVALGAGWSACGPGVWESALGGSYLAGNNRSDILADDYPTLPSRTSPVCAGVCALGGFNWSNVEMPPELAGLTPILAACAAGVELLWHGRPTRVYRLRGERWWVWPLDDWDNCVDADWLAFCAARGET
jgi:hypothetical protein